jgi:hypothetical protein
MIGQFFGQEILKKLLRTGNTSVQLQAGSRFRVGGLGVKLDNVLSLNLSANGIGGLDTGSILPDTLYYIYAVASGTTVGLVASLSANSPSGFLVYKEIGKAISNTDSEITDPINYGEDAYQFISFHQIASTLLDLSGEAMFNLSQIQHEGSWLVNTINNVPSTRTEFWPLFNKLDIDVDWDCSTNGSSIVKINGNGVGYGSWTGTLWPSGTASYKNRIGTINYITVGTSSISIVGSDSSNLSIEARMKYEDII